MGKTINTLLYNALVDWSGVEPSGMSRCCRCELTFEKSSSLLCDDCSLEWNSYAHDATEEITRDSFVNWLRMSPGWYPPCLSPGIISAWAER